MEKLINVQNIKTWKKCKTKLNNILRSANVHLNKKDYYCDGICEKCKLNKHYGDQLSGYYTCDNRKVKGLNVIAPIPPFNYQK